MINKLLFVSSTEAIAHWARATPDAIAAVEGELAWSYAALALNVAQAADMLRSAGLRRGMIAGIQCDQQYLHLVLILGCEIIGAAHLSMSPADLTAAGELAERCDLLCVETDAGPVVAHPRLIGLSRDTLGELTRRRIGGEVATILETVQPLDEPARLATTSGTTGRRKFVCHTRRALRHMVAGVQYTLKDDPECYNYISMYRFILWSTYASTMLALEHGKLVAFCGVENFLPVTRSISLCHTMLLPGDALRLAVIASQVGQRADSCCIRVIGSAAPPSLRAALRGRLTNNIISSYASNETSYISMTDDNEVGTLLPDVLVRIVDDTGLTRNVGDPGIIMVRSPRISSGYLWDDKLTARQFVGGWFRTSDIGVIPEPGKLIVIGRADDMLNIGGIKFAPQPLEEQAKSIPGVTDAVLLSVTNPLLMNELHVFIERQDPACNERIGEQLLTIVSKHIHKFSVHFVEQFPRTQTGKVQRGLLRDLLVEREPPPGAMPVAALAYA